MSINCTVPRIGFACKYLHPDQSQPKKVLEEIQRPLNTRATTVRWLNEHRDQAEQRLWDIMEHNIASTKRLITYVSNLPQNLRMLRLSSDLLPLYTQPDWGWFWRTADARAFCEKGFREMGDMARQINVRLSFHPGQFCVLASDNPDIVTRSIEEFEYHADMARWMGYGQTFQDFKINVHISGRQGPNGIKDVLKRLSTEARNCITIENDEMSWGVDASLELADHVALVLDIHHHFIATGEYIQPTDSRYLRILDSWRGVRPVIHYSYSRDEHLPCGFAHDDYPVMDQLLAQGCKKSKLRAHSNSYPNAAVNSWALSFWDTADIMCEAKNKNLASLELYNYANTINKKSRCGFLDVPTQKNSTTAQTFAVA